MASVYRTLLGIRSFNKVPVRCSSVNVESIIGDKDNNFKQAYDHIYKKHLTRLEAVRHIIDNVVYRTDDFIVTNKPYGIGITKKIKKIESYQPQTFENIFLEDILPDIAIQLGCKSLQVTKVPERFASGVMILARTEQGHQQIIQGLKRAKAGTNNFQSYIVVTIGHLTKKKTETKFGLQISTEGNMKGPIVIENYSGKSVKQKKTKIIRWNHEVISESSLASLVKVNISNSHNNSLKLYMATKCLSPVLGDQIFNKKVLNLFGVTLLANARSDSGVMELNPGFLSALKLTTKERTIIPCHVHLQSLALPLKNKEFTIFRVPLPESFIWTCQQLNLNLPYYLCFSSGVKTD